MSGNGTGGVAAPGLLPLTQETGRAAAGRGAAPRRGAAQGPPAEASVAALERLAVSLVARLEAAKALLLASMIDEAVADEAEGEA